jgi:hypothetical protein
MLFFLGEKKSHFSPYNQRVKLLIIQRFNGLKDINNESNCYFLEDICHNCFTTTKIHFWKTLKMQI